MASPTVDRRFGLVGNAALKAPVRVIASSAIALSGEQTVDGVAVKSAASNTSGVADRVLVAAQADPTQNGIYDVNTSAWSRSADADGIYDFVKGTTVFVTDGTANAGTYWQITSAGPITPGTTAITWTTVITAISSAVATATTGAATATTQAGIATTQAGIATSQATTATTQAGLASGYAAAAATGAKFFDTIALGLAAVADGATFGVKAGGADGFTRATVFRRNSSTTYTKVGEVFAPGEVDAVENKLSGAAASPSYSVALSPVGFTTGGGAASTGFIWLNNLALRAGILKTLSVNVNTVGDGTGKFVIARLNAGTYTVIQAIAVSGIAGTGLTTLDVSASAYQVKDGDILGWHAATGGAQMGFVAAGSTGLVATKASVSVSDTFTTSASAAQMGVAATVAVMPQVVSERLNSITAAIEAAYDAATTIDSITPDSLDMAFTFGWVSAPMKTDGFVTSVSFRFSAPGTGEILFIGPNADGALTCLGKYPVAVAAGANVFSIGSDAALAASQTLPSVLWMPAGTRLGYRTITGQGPRYATNGASDPLLNFSGAPNVGDVVTLASSGVAADGAISFQYQAPHVQPYLTPALLDMVTQARATVAGFNVTASGIVNRDRTPLQFSATQALTPASTNVRYDVIYYDILAGTVGVAVGTERTTDAVEFIPSLSKSYYLPLFNARVTTSSVTAVPVWNIRDGSPYLLDADLDRERRRSRLCIQKTIGKLRRGAAVKVLAFGDSIQALQSNTPSSATPNGTVRDVAAASLGSTNHYLRDNIGADVVDAIPLFTSVQLGRADDGGGAIHTKFGFMWDMVVAMQKSGSTVTYDNFGVGGTATTDALSGASASAWLSAAIALAPDLVVVNFGMNEYNSANTEANMVTIANLLQAAGIEVLVMGVARKPNLTTKVATDQWRYTHRALYRAAVYTNCAFQPLRHLYDDDYLGSVGRTSSDTCSANAINHPGIAEHKAIGKELIKLAMGDA